MSLSFEKGFKNSNHILSPDNDVSFTARLKEWESVMTDGPRSHHIPLNGGAIKVITLQTIKKGHESPRQLWLLPHFQSWAVFSLPPLCPGRSIWLGTRFRSCHRRSSRRSGCHQTWFARRRRLATTSHNGARHRLTFGGRKEGSLVHSAAKQSYSRCARPRSGTHWSRVRRRHMTRMCLPCHWLHVSEWHPCPGSAAPWLSPASERTGGLQRTCHSHRTVLVPALSRVLCVQKGRQRGKP